MKLVGVGSPCDVVHCATLALADTFPYISSIPRRERIAAHRRNALCMILLCRDQFVSSRLPLQERAGYNVIAFSCLTRSSRFLDLRLVFRPPLWQAFVLGGINQALFIARTFASCILVGLTSRCFVVRVPPRFSAFANT
jgi:hypothetical protein